jgi:hypothetical protein
VELPLFLSVASTSTKMRSLAHTRLSMTHGSSQSPSLFPVALKSFRKTSTRQQQVSSLLSQERSGSMGRLGCRRRFRSRASTKGKIRSR